MEGAAVAQVCYKLGVPYVVVRVISDSGDNSAPVDHDKFCNTLAGVVCFAVADEIVRNM